MAFQTSAVTVLLCYFTYMHKSNLKLRFLHLLVYYIYAHIHCVLKKELQFLPARRYASAGLCDSDVSVCPSVRHTPVLRLAERKQDREMYTV